MGLGTRPVYERIHRKTEKREAVREKKAESAAKLEKSIESELLERLKKGTYGDIYNFAPEEFNKVLDEEAGDGCGWRDDVRKREGDRGRGSVRRGHGRGRGHGGAGRCAAEQEGREGRQVGAKCGCDVDLLRARTWSWSTRRRRRIRSWRRISVHLCVIRHVCVYKQSH